MLDSIDVLTFNSKNRYALLKYICFLSISDFQFINPTVFFKMALNFFPTFNRRNAINVVIVSNELTKQITIYISL